MTKLKAATNEKSWQQTKSENTRSTILDAAIQCFYDLGYNNTTTEKIAKKAGVSRGAMLHHFRSRMELIRATVSHLTDKRVREFEEQEAIVQAGEEHTLIEEGIDAYWAQLKSPLFIVFHELRVAARTDAELSEVMQPAMKEFNNAWLTAAERVFPDLAQSKAFETANHLTAYLLEGMAVSRGAEDAVSSDMVSWLKGQLKTMFSDVKRVKRKAASKAAAKPPRKPAVKTKTKTKTKPKRKTASSRKKT